MLSTTDFKRYYEILGINKTATLEEIKQAYRQLARQYHPDLNGGDKEAEDSFKLINEAYQVLSDPDRHQDYEEYDRYSQPTNPAKTSPPKAAANPTSSKEFNLEEYSNFNDFIYDLLGYFLQDPATGKPVYTSRNTTK